MATDTPPAEPADREAAVALLTAVPIVAAGNYYRAPWFDRTADAIAAILAQIRLTQQAYEAAHQRANLLADERATLLTQVRRAEAERDEAERALRSKGYRKSCDIPVCNCGDQWAHGGHAERRLHEFEDARLEAEAERDALQAQLAAAVAEGTALRQALEDVTKPLARLRRETEAKGPDYQLSPMAGQVANDPNYLQGIAREALATPGPGAALAAAVERAWKALEAAHEYFDDRGDADCTGDPPSFHGNEELHLAAECDEALDQLRAAREGRG